MLTPATLASLRAGFCPGEAVADALLDWIGPVSFKFWTASDDWRAGVVDGTRDRLMDHHHVYTGGRQYARPTMSIRLPLSRPECRQRIATVMGVGRKCDNACVNGMTEPGVECSRCRATGHLRPPAPARHLLPQSELGELPEVLAGQSGLFLGCHVARVLAGLGGVRGVAGPWRPKSGIERGWIRCVVAVQPNDREYRLGNGLCLADRKPEIRHEDAEALLAGFALDNGDGTFTLPWPEVPDAAR